MDSKLDKYINSVKNPIKKIYAHQFSRWVLSGEIGQEPKVRELGSMAAQAVRLNIYEIVRGK